MNESVGARRKERETESQRERIIEREGHTERGIENKKMQIFQAISGTVSVSLCEKKEKIY